MILSQVLVVIMEPLCLVAAEVGKLTPPPAALTPPGSVAEPLGRGLFPCIKSLSKKEHLERLRALIEQ